MTVANPESTIMTEETKLKPCPNPWCASHRSDDPELFAAHAPIMVADPSGGRWAHNFQVACPVCPIQGPYGATKRDALTAWNTRQSFTGQEGVERDAALEEAAKVADLFIGSTPPRFSSGIAKGLPTSQQADNCINAMKVRSQVIASAIRRLKSTPSEHAADCDWHVDQCPQECTCAALNPQSLDQGVGKSLKKKEWSRFSDGSLRPFLTPSEYAELRDDDRFLYNKGPKPEGLK